MNAFINIAFNQVGIREAMKSDVAWASFSKVCVARVARIMRIEQKIQ